jgi:hypothetical protein
MIRTRSQFLIVLGLIAVLALAATAAGAAPKGGSKGGGGGGKGGGGTTGGGGSLTLVMSNDVNGDGLPNWGDSITFNVTTTATNEPHVNVKCLQNGTVVYGATTGYYASYPWPWTQIMQLSSQSWTGGDASCTAVLSSYSGTRVTTLGTLDFQAYA